MSQPGFGEISGSVGGIPVGNWGERMRGLFRSRLRWDVELGLLWDFESGLSDTVGGGWGSLPPIPSNNASHARKIYFRVAKGEALNMPFIFVEECDGFVGIERRRRLFDSGPSRWLRLHVLGG